MKKELLLIRIFIFWGILILPIAIYPAMRQKLDRGNYENRTLIAAEDLKEANWKNFFVVLEQYLEDNMFYKNECVKLLNGIDENIFHDPFNRSVLVGKDEWLFYKKDNCIQDYRGVIEVSQERLDDYCIAANQLDDILGNTKLVLMVTPNKESVYGEDYMPERVKRYSESSRADQIVKALKENTKLDIVYPKKAIKDYKGVKQVWLKYDTHWNSVGAFIAAQELLSELDMPTTDLDQVEIVEDGYRSGDLANMMGKANRYNDDVNFTVEKYLDDVAYEQVETEQQSNLNYSMFESDAENDQTVLFVGDSFLAYMEFFLAKNFRKTIFIHRDNYELLGRNLILENKPDIVVFQTAERFIGTYDAVMKKYYKLWSATGF